MAICFAGVHGDKLFLRLSDAGMIYAMRNCVGVTPFESIPGRAMKGYAVSSQNSLL
jgi:hypothetical protein